MQGYTFFQGNMDSGVIYIYIYIYRQRERERYRSVLIHWWQVYGLDLGLLTSQGKKKTIKSDNA